MQVILFVRNAIKEKYMLNDDKNDKQQGCTLFVPHIVFTPGKSNLSLQKGLSLRSHQTRVIDHFRIVKSLGCLGTERGMSWLSTSGSRKKKRSLIIATIDFPPLLVWITTGLVCYNFHCFQELSLNIESDHACLKTTEHATYFHYLGPLLSCLQSHPS